MVSKAAGTPYRATGDQKLEASPTWRSIQDGQDAPDPGAPCLHRHPVVVTNCTARRRANWQRDRSSTRTGLRLSIPPQGCPYRWKRLSQATLRSSSMNTRFKLIQHGNGAYLHLPHLERSGFFHGFVTSRRPLRRGRLRNALLAFGFESHVLMDQEHGDEVHVIADGERPTAVTALCLLKIMLRHHQDGRLPACILYSTRSLLLQSSTLDGAEQPSASCAMQCTRWPSWCQAAEYRRPHRAGIGPALRGPGRRGRHLQKRRLWK